MVGVVLRCRSERLGHGPVRKGAAPTGCWGLVARQSQLPGAQQAGHGWDVKGVRAENRSETIEAA